MLSLFSATFVSFILLKSCWYHQTITLDEQLNLFFFHSTVQQILKDLHTSVWAFMSVTALICSLEGLINICVLCVSMLLSRVASFQNELSISSLCPSHDFPQCLSSSVAGKAIITSSRCCSKYLQVFLCSFIKTSPLSVYCKR